MAQSTQRRVLITGAGRGLGLALTAELVARGHRVWGGVRSTDPGPLRDLGPDGIVALDVIDGESVRGALDELGRELGGLDLLINNAGVDARAFGAAGDARGPFDVDPDVLSGVLEVNAVGPMTVTRTALPLLRKGTTPLVMNVSSQLGSMDLAASMGADAAYCTSKAALNMWTVKAANDLRSEGIAMVAVHPGWVSTDMGGPSASLSPTESATALADLADRLDIGDTGRFLRWDGVDHAW